MGALGDDAPVEHGVATCRFLSRFGCKGCVEASSSGEDIDGLLVEFTLSWCPGMAGVGEGEGERVESGQEFIADRFGDVMFGIFQGLESCTGTE